MPTQPDDLETRTGTRSEMLVLRNCVKEIRFYDGVSEQKEGFGAHAQLSVQA